MDELKHFDLAMGMRGSGESSNNRMLRHGDNLSQWKPENVAAVRRLQRKLGRGYDLMMGELDDGAEWKNLTRRDHVAVVSRPQG